MGCPLHEDGCWHDRISTDNWSLRPTNHWRNTPVDLIDFWTFLTASEYILDEKGETILSTDQTPNWNFALLFLKNISDI
jgi:hypothetical protein